MKTASRIDELYDVIDKLNVHTDKDFKTIVFSDTVLVAADPMWNSSPDQAIMWLAEFSQDLFYRLSHRDIHFRAIITKGEFIYREKENYLSYHGQALVDCYEKETAVKCCGTFLDRRLAKHSTVFALSDFDPDLCFVHLMQHLDDVSFKYTEYPISGQELLDTGMGPWVAYLVRYLKIIYSHSKDASLPSDVRTKFMMTWEMISSRHDGLLRRLAEAKFDASKVIMMNWQPIENNIGTTKGAWG